MRLLGGYQRSLAEMYDHQIRLLRKLERMRAKLMAGGEEMEAPC